MTSSTGDAPAASAGRLAGADVRNMGMLRQFCTGAQGQGGILATETEDVVAVVAIVAKMSDAGITGPLQAAIEHAHLFMDAMAAAQRGIAAHSQGEEYVGDKGVSGAATKEFLAPE